MKSYYALHFNGSTFLSYEAPTKWAGDSSFTVSFWMRADPPPPEAFWILDIGDDPYGFHWVVGPAGAIFGVHNQEGFQNRFSFKDYRGKWTFVTTVFDQESKTLKTYMNGKEEEGSQENVTIQCKSGLVRIGWPPDVEKPFFKGFKGLIDEVRIWKGARSEKQIQQQMYERLSESEIKPELISYLNVADQTHLGSIIEPVAEGDLLAAAMVDRVLDCVTGKEVTASIGTLDLVRSQLPTGGPGATPNDGEVTIFERKSYQGNSWRFHQSTAVPDVRQDLANIGVASLRVGDRTTARIFAEPWSKGLSQQLMSDLPSLDKAKLDDSNFSPSSLQVYSSPDTPHRGDCAIVDRDGKYLKASPQGWAVPLVRTSEIDDGGLFRIEELNDRTDDEVEVAIWSPVHNSYLGYLESGESERLTLCDPQITDRSRWILVGEEGEHHFSLKTLDEKKWVTRVEGGFGLRERDPETEENDDREIFTRAFWACEDEAGVGELRAGEIAFYENSGYWGRAWVFHGDQRDLAAIEPLKDLKIGSVRLGPGTCITLFKQAEREDAIDPDILVEAPDLAAITTEPIKSFKSWRVVSPGSIGLESTATLSQDYRYNDKNKMEAYHAYRTNVGLPHNVSTVDIATTEEATVEITGTSYELGPDKSCTVEIDSRFRLIVTSAAIEGGPSPQPLGVLHSAGLKLRTDTMSPDQHIVLHPDREVHDRLANLDGDQLWDAEDAERKPMLNKKVINKEGAKHVQAAISAMMRTVAYTERRIDVSGDTRGVDGEPTSGDEAPSSCEWATYSRKITQEHIKDAGWILCFDGDSGTDLQLSSKFSEFKAGSAESPRFSPLTTEALNGLWETDPDDLLQSGLGDFLTELYNDGKEIVHVIVKKGKELLVQIRYRIGEGIEKVKNFVVTLARQAAAVAQKIFEQIVDGIHKLVEWLSFLFNWDGILEVQEHLAGDIMKALQYANNAVGSDTAKIVQERLDAVKDDLEELLAPIESYFERDEARSQLDRGRPPESSHPHAEEKLHWFFAKMTGEGDAAAPALNLQDVTALAVPDGFQDFLNKVSDEVNGIVDPRVRGHFAKAIDSLTKSLKDPNRALSLESFIVPVLELLKAIAEVLLNLAGRIVLLLLNLIEALLTAVEKILDAPIKVPTFVRDLWSLAIGKELELNLLNLTTLAVAIPTSIICRAVQHGEQEVTTPGAGMWLTDGVSDETKKLRSAVAYSIFTFANGMISLPLDLKESVEWATVKQSGEEEMTNVVDWTEKDSAPLKKGHFGKVPNIPGGDFLEGVCWVLELGALINSWPGGYPFAPNAGEYFPQEDPAECWDTAVWIYEGCLVGFDLVGLVVEQSELRRTGPMLAGADTVFGFAHLLGVLIVAGKEHQQKKYKDFDGLLAWKTTQGVLGTLPECLAFLMLPQLTRRSEGFTLLAYLGISSRAAQIDAGINLYLGAKGWIDPELE